MKTTLSKAALLAIAKAKVEGANAILDFVNALPDEGKTANVVSEVKPKRKYTKRKVEHPHKGRKYAPGTHWTQKPENKRKLAKIGRLAKAAALARRAKAK